LLADLRFEWDQRKNVGNRAKHGVSFEEAVEVFTDERGILIPDPDHSDTEDRFILLGTSSLRTLVVCHCYRADVIRIFSARKANRFERATYLQGLSQ